MYTHTHTHTHTLILLGNSSVNRMSLGSLMQDLIPYKLTFSYCLVFSKLYFVSMDVFC